MTERKVIGFHCVPKKDGKGIDLVAVFEGDPIPKDNFFKDVPDELKNTDSTEAFEQLVARAAQPVPKAQDTPAHHEGYSEK
jgi:hypothetical protein